MAARARSLLAVIVVMGALAAVALSRRTSPDAVARAAGEPVGTVVTEDDLPVLDGGPIPSVAGATGWLNTGPLAPDDLAGKVVLVDFWTFGCINCRHTQPYVIAWHERYAADGLVVLSVHTPEFAHEADPDNVRAYVAAEGITYPVALDAEHAVWRTWQNHAWPAFYLYDRHGQLRATHLGEGRYAATEDAIRALLGIDPSSPRAVV